MATWVHSEFGEIPRGRLSDSTLALHQRFSLIFVLVPLEEPGRPPNPSSEQINILEKKHYTYYNSERAAESSSRAWKGLVDVDLFGVVSFGIFWVSHT